MVYKSGSDNAAVEFASGAFGASVDVVIFHWVDTCKVRAQDRRPVLPWLELRQIHKSSGVGLIGAARVSSASISSLYAGFTTGCSLKVPYMAFMFMSHTLNQRLLRMVGADPEADTTIALSAALVGVEASTFLAPLEMIRCQGQNMGKGGIISATRYIASLDHSPWGKISTFSRGMVPTINREVKYCLGLFFLQGWLDCQLRYLLQFEEGSISTQIVAASTSGCLCCLLSHPDDVIKTRMQTHIKKESAEYKKFSGYFATGKVIIQQEGIRYLYRGWVWRCLIRVPMGNPVVILSANWFRPHFENTLTGRVLYEGI